MGIAMWKYDGCGTREKNKGLKCVVRKVAYTSVLTC